MSEKAKAFVSVFSREVGPFEETVNREILSYLLFRHCGDIGASRAICWMLLGGERQEFRRDSSSGRV